MSGQKEGHLDQVLKKTCVHRRGHIFGPILMKLGQNDCLDVILDEFEKWAILGQKLSL